VLAPVVPPSPARTRAWRRPHRLLGPQRRRILEKQASCRVVGAAKRRSLIGSGRSDIFEPGNISEMLRPELPGRDSVRADLRALHQHIRHGRPPAPAEPRSSTRLARCPQHRHEPNRSL